jgi:KaiC/GvpD/RAD55 family RecA-like ATPase
MGGESSTDVASTGSVVLDNALRGGLPKNRSVLVTGGPGTGKSTLSMQFLQEGLKNGEKVLFVSTEQTYEELKDSFEPFDFDLDHDDLSITTLHAKNGKTIESGDEEVLTIKTLEGGDLIGGGYSAPFNSKYITQHLKRDSVDRVVLDSVSGLRQMGDSYDMYRRAVLDLIRTFNDEMGATAILTAEEIEADGGGDAETLASTNAVQFNTHGVLRLWRQNIRGDYHRFLEVVKMRGVGHDTRVYEIDFGREGVKVIPRHRTHSSVLSESEYLNTGVDGLDELMGGGIIRGGNALLEHDGKANTHLLLLNWLEQAAERDMSIVLVPPVELPPSRLRKVLEDRIGDMEELLEDDGLFLIDYPNIWETEKRNVFKPSEYEDGFEGIYEKIKQRGGEDGIFSIVSLEALLSTMSDKEIRRVRFWEEENFYGDMDTSVYLSNPGTINERVAEFYKNSAWQVLNTWVEETGLQYVKLDKSPSGYMGSTRNVEFLNQEPKVRIQMPPGSGEDT